MVGQHSRHAGECRAGYHGGATEEGLGLPQARGRRLNTAKRFVKAMAEGDINTVLLRAFLAVVGEGSFARASLKLGVTQPTVSARIKTLERRLGASVFRRGGASAVRLTAVGRELLPDAEAMVALHDRIVSGHRARRFW